MSGQTKLLLCTIKLSEGSNGCSMFPHFFGVCIFEEQPGPVCCEFVLIDGQQDKFDGHDQLQYPLCVCVHDPVFFFTCDMLSVIPVNMSSQ